MKETIRVIIPAYNEEKSIGKVIKALPESVAEIIVVDNNSTDHTTEEALIHGATVLFEPKKGYGNACLRGIRHLEQYSKTTHIVVFIDGDYSDYPEELNKIVAPITNQDVDFVLGSRVKKLREKGAMQPQQRFGNWIATSLMKLIYNSTFTDLGPFRAIRFKTLKTLNMKDQTYGWTVEMQLKILKQKIPYVEVPVRYRNRIGVSKVSGTVKGSIFAGIKILTWIIKYSFK